MAEASLCAGVAGKNCLIEMSLLPSDAPLLFSKPQLKALKAKIDFETGQVVGAEALALQTQPVERRG